MPSQQQRSTSSTTHTTPPLDLTIDQSTNSSTNPPTDQAHLATPSQQQRSTSTTLVLTLLDENDNAPVFPAADFAVSIYENSSIGAEVFTASATDLDRAENGRVTFSLTGGSDESAAAFAIDQSTGVVTLTATIDRESISTHGLTLVASDHGTNPLETDSPLLITVLDCNDNRPLFCVFQSSVCSPLARGDEYDRAIPESAVVGSAVVTISATDADEGVNAAPRYRLEEDGGDSATFAIDALRGVISVSRSLDTEVVAAHNLTVYAVDLAFEVAVQVIITVVDVNEHSPVFAAAAIDVTIPEDAPVGTVIAAFEATDADYTADAHGAVSYRILDNGVPFTVLSDGRVLLAAPLDHDAVPSYTISIQAYDGGADPAEPGAIRTATALLTVDVTDINEHGPAFFFGDAGSFGCTLAENSLDGATCDQVGQP